MAMPVYDPDDPLGTSYRPAPYRPSLNYGDPLPVQMGSAAGVKRRLPKAVQISQQAMRTPPNTPPVSLEPKQGGQGAAGDASPPGGYHSPHAAMIARLEAELAEPGKPTYAPEEQEQMQARNRREYEMGLLGILSGDETLKAAGGMIFKNSLAGREKRVTDKGVYDPLTGEYKLNAEGQRETMRGRLERAYASEAAGQQQWDLSRKAAEDREALVRVAAALKPGRDTSAADAVRTDRKLAADEKATQEFAKRTGDLTPVLFAARQVQEMLDTYGDKEIPGLGHDTFFGPAQSKEGVLNRGKVQAVANALLRAQSGQAVTLSEETRQAAATLATGAYSEKEFRQNWPLLAGSLNANISNIRAGFHPDVVSAFEQRGGQFTPVQASSGYSADRRAGADRRGAKPPVATGPGKVVDFKDL